MSWTILLLLSLLGVFIALWNYANEVSTHIEHHDAEIVSKKSFPVHQGNMMYVYRHGYLGEMERSYDSITPVLQNDLQIQHHDPAGPGVLNFENSHIFHEVETGEKVRLEVRKVIRRNKVTKKTSTSIHPVSILKSNGRKLDF